MHITRIVVGAVLLINAMQATAAPCTKAQRAHADVDAQLNDAATMAAMERHLPWGAPTISGADNAIMLAASEFVLAYDPDLRVAIWTAHVVESAKLGKVDRTECFRPDPRLPLAIASDPSDYDEPIYDQGHLVNSADMTMSMDAQLRSFWMSNMAPETCRFNRGVWQMLEGLVRLWAKAADDGRVYVITGTVFDRNGDRKRDADDSAMRMKSRNGKERVAVPSDVYDIIVRKRHGTLETIAVVMPNNDADPKGEAAFAYIGDHIASIAALEEVTGLTFFKGTTLAKKKAKAAKALWQFSGKKPGSLTAGCK